MLLRSLTVDRADFEAGTGWSLRPEGACKGDVCIPLPGLEGNPIDVPSLAERMGLPLVSEPALDLHALGPSSTGSRALVTAEAPELSLPDLEGKPFALSSLHGQKVVILAWAPY